MLPHLTIYVMCVFMHRLQIVTYTFDMQCEINSDCFMRWVNVCSTVYGQDWKHPTTLKNKKMVAVHSVDTNSTPDKAALRTTFVISFSSYLA